MSDVWKPITRQALHAWRRNLPKGWTREDSVYVRKDLPVVDSDGDVASIPVESGGFRSHYEARETIDRLVKDFLEWARSDPSTLLPKVRQMKKAGGLAHQIGRASRRERV